MDYRPEGCIFRTPDNQRYISSVDGLREAMVNGVILEAHAAMCTGEHDLIIDLPCAKGIIPRTEGAIGVQEGTTRDIAVISRVNKIVCFKVTALSCGDDGCIKAVLSRRSAQEECRRNYIDALKTGDIIDARVTHLEKFGCFVDIGCGIPSMIPIDAISVSRIAHPSDRFSVGQMIKAVVSRIDGQRICLTHKELLGTWKQNAEHYHSGETVPGVVRSVEDYGIFVELSPNLAGLAEPKENVMPGQSVSVYIKAVLPDKMKVKLVIVDVCPDTPSDRSMKYYIDAGHIDSWVYSTDESAKRICTSF